MSSRSYTSVVSAPVSQECPWGAIIDAVDISMDVSARRTTCHQEVNVYLSYLTCDPSPVTFAIPLEENIVLCEEVGEATVILP
jgi:hypothetical protein